MDEAPLSPRAAEQLAGTIGEDLVHVHIGLRATTGLPDHKWKLIVEGARQDLVAGANDRVRLRLVQQLELLIDQGGRLLDECQRLYQSERHPLARDLEVLQ